MKKAYSLDYSIERDIDRVIAVRAILNELPSDPSQNDLEQMGSYILYGKDENGYNAVQRGEITDGNKRYNTFKVKDDNLQSLDEMLENPNTDEQTFKPVYNKQRYKKPTTSIHRPKYAKDGTLKDIGDGDIPGIWEIWDSIDRLERRIAVAEGKLPPAEGTTKPELSQYTIWQLKHTVVDLRRHQYYLKDSYKPTLHFMNVDKPKQQFINWAEDAAYWMPLPEWQRKVSNQLLPRWSTKLSDYETRLNPSTGAEEVHWIVRQHTFDYENKYHIRALISNLNDLREYFHNKIDTYARALLFDFDFYRDLANLSEVRNFILDLKIKKYTTEEISQMVFDEYGVQYGANHISTILARIIPNEIATAAAKHRVMLETPQSECKKCFRCGRYLPRTKLFYSSNVGRKDHFSSICKECERARRIENKKVNEIDARRKDTQMPTMQTRKTNS